MSERETIRACAVFSVMITLGLMLGGLSWLPRAEARALSAIETGTATITASPATTSTPSPPRVLAATEVPAEPDQTEVVAAPVAAPPPEATTQSEPVPVATPVSHESLLAHNQVVVYYGSPISAGLGILGAFPPDEAARRVRDEAGNYDRLNGDARGAVPAMDLIYAQVQAEPTENGLYLQYLDPTIVRGYLDIAEKDDVQLILDLQIGRGNVLAEVQKIEPLLRNPRVHVAIDPEYAVGPEGIPIETPGTITGDDINEVQDYLSGIVGQYQLPPKLLIIHQYMEGTVINGGAVKVEPNVDVVLNMDAFGDRQEKESKYGLFASRPYAHRRAFNIFLEHDSQVLSAQEALQLSPSPDMIFYQ